MKQYATVIIVFFFLESCTNESRCVEDCNQDLSLCLLLANNEQNALGWAFLCQNSCSNCKAKCQSTGSGTRTSSSRSSGGGGGGGGSGGGGGGGGGGHGGGGHGGGGLITYQ